MSRMRQVLVLGGTAWLGRRIAASAAAGGAQVVCLARGTSGEPPEGVTLVRADRTEPGAYDAVATQDWDEVIEISYEPQLVASALASLGPLARHWTLVSSVSVYRRDDEVDADESAELVEVPTDTDDLDYAQAKAAAERASTQHLHGRLLVVRPGLVAGPGDPSDRFGYWMARLARGGRALTPTLAGRRVQVIDVDDLAGFVVAAGLEQRTGVVNAVGHSHDLAEVLDLVADAAGSTDGFVAREDEWLLARDVHYWAGPRSLPLWLPPTATGFTERRNDAYLASGGAVRPITETIVRVLADERERGIDRPRRSGLSAEQEQALLDESPDARPR